MFLCTCRYVYLIVSICLSTCVCICYRVYIIVCEFCVRYPVSECVCVSSYVFVCVCRFVSVYVSSLVRVSSCLGLCVFLFYLKPEKWVVLSQKEVVESGREIIFLIDIVL